MTTAHSTSFPQGQPIKSWQQMTEIEKILQLLSDEGLRPVDIARRTGDRVSERTIYRWKKGECQPKQADNLRVMKSLLKKIQSDPKFLLSNRTI